MSARRFSIPLVAAATTLFLLGVTPPALAATLVVDDDGMATEADCDSTIATPYTTIQSAVTAAVDGDLVEVCPGTYDEQVVIESKDITLQGNGPTTIIKPSSPTTFGEQYTYPSCVLPGWGGLDLAAEVLVQDSDATTVQDLLIDGSMVTSLPSGAERLAGILYGESGGTISNVTINDIKTSGYADRTYVIDLSACEGTARSVSVLNTTIEDYSRTAIQAQGDDLTATIDDNDITGPGTIGPANVPNGIVFIQDAVGSADGNILRAMHHTGSNSLAGALMAYSTTEAAGITFSNNEVFDADDGVLLAKDAANVTAAGNDLHHNKKGVQIENGATNNLVTGNSIVANSIAGIYLEGSLNPAPGTENDSGPGNEASGNVIEANLEGAINYAPTAFDAEGNWWGDPSGPSGAGPGTGDSVTTNVDFDPWCVNETCTEPATTEPATEVKGEVVKNVITGTPGNDRIRGTPGDDVIRALAGNDKVNGLAGDDKIIGGAGDDRLKGGAGRDRLLGGAGDDRLNGGGGTDRCLGGGGTDRGRKCEKEKSIP